MEKNCTKCGNQESTVSHKIEILPRILIIHLKRFKPNFEKQTYEKLTTFITIDKQLNLLPFCNEKTQSPIGSDSFMQDLPKLLPQSSPTKTKPIGEDSTSAILVEDSQDEDMKCAIEESLKAFQNEKIWREKSLHTEEKLTSQSISAKYHLQCIINHEGSSATYGHYVADVFDQSSHGWRNYNDSVSKEVTEQKVLSNGRNSYILFYVHDSFWNSK